jgi:hypothetical protein
VTLAEDLFHDDEWRILWWEVFVRMHANKEFPNDVEDISFVAYAAESAIRHWNHKVRERLGPAVAKALDHPLVLTEPMATERRLLQDFIDECMSPSYATETEVGPWSADDPHPGQPELERIRQLPQQSLRDVAALAHQRLTTRAWVTWVQRSSRLAGLTEAIGFVNYDLAEVKVHSDCVGELFVDVPSEANSETLTRILNYHGFDIAQRPLRENG